MRFFLQAIIFLGSESREEIGSAIGIEGLIKQRKDRVYSVFSWLVYKRFSFSVFPGPLCHVQRPYRYTRGFVEACLH